MAMNITDAQTLAMRRKAQGDQRPLTVIVQEIMESPEAVAGLPPAAEAPVQEVTPTPAAPVPVGQPVEVKAAVPPMVNPYAAVQRAREVAQPEPQPVEEIKPDASATDVALENARQQGKPEADPLFRLSQMIQSATEREAAAVKQVRDEIGIDPREEALYKAREERFAKLEADIAKNDKKQIWNAIAMAGARMAQSNSPYFAAALAEGLQAGLEGYNASKAASAEKKARIADAKEDIAIGRIRGEREAESRALADRETAVQAASRTLDQMAKAKEIEWREETDPIRKRGLEMDLQRIGLQMQSMRQQMAFARNADARAAQSHRAAMAASGSSSGLDRIYAKGLEEQGEFARKFALDNLEGFDPAEPEWNTRFNQLRRQGEAVYLNTNPAFRAAYEKYNPAPKVLTAPPKKKEEERPFRWSSPSTWGF